MIKSFSQFESYYDPPEHVSFVENNENALVTLEKVLFPTIGKEKSDVFWEDFWDAISDPECHKVYEQFEDSLSSLTESWYDKLYYKKGFDVEPDSVIMTDEYKRIESEAIEKFPYLEFSSNTIMSLTIHRSSQSRKRKDFMNNALIVNIFRHDVEGYWKIYQTAIDGVHQKRGKIAGKKFGF